MRNLSSLVIKIAQSASCAVVTPKGSPTGLTPALYVSHRSHWTMVIVGSRRCHKSVKRSASAANEGVSKTVPKAAPKGYGALSSREKCILCCKTPENGPSKRAIQRREVRSRLCMEVTVYKQLVFVMRL
jgi:hypothetical protein